jgi:hypothetical protein
VDDRGGGDDSAAAADDVKVITRRDALAQLLAVPAAARLPWQRSEWAALFNGRDLSGWETFLGKPHGAADAIGLNRDPTGVFSVVRLDGAPAIRISGEIYGALTTVAEHADYHLRFEFKWGERRWPPREDQRRDTGCCYHGVGPHGASYGFWMQSCEFQIMENDVGDFYSLAGVMVDVDGERVDPANPRTDVLYRRGAPRIAGHTRRIVKSADYERPGWNTLELYCVGQSSVHVVNGRVNLRLSGIRHVVDGREVPLTKGRIQLQSEAAEVFYRNIAIRPIRAIPPLPE